MVIVGADQPVDMADFPLFVEAFAGAAQASMKTNILRPCILSTAIFAVSLSAFTGCSQVQTTTQTPETPVAVPVLAGAAQYSPADLQGAVDEAYAKFKDDTSGKNADYIPYLAGVPSNLFAIVIVTKDGQIYSAGDTNYLFSIQSCSKVFTLCQVMEESGPDAVLKKIGVEPTGMPFNSIVALGYYGNKAVNPMVNAGAIAAVSMVKAGNAEDRWNKILAYQSRFAGEPLHLIDEVYKSESDTNFRNRGIAWILYNNGNLFCDPPEATDVYTKECSIGVSARELAIMGATLADGGVNPITKERCIESKYVPRVLAVMMMAGFYDESGEWAYRAGLPAKTGVGGGIVAIVPGKMAIVGFAPPLNDAGNSVRATEAIDYIVDKLDLDIFGSLK